MNLHWKTLSLHVLLMCLTPCFLFFPRINTAHFYLKISHPAPAVTILYTLDGSLPMVERLEGETWQYKKNYQVEMTDEQGPLYVDTMETNVYSDSLKIVDISTEKDRYADISSSYYSNAWYVETSNQENVEVYKGQVVRAVAFKNGTYSEVISRHYFIDDGPDTYQLSVACIAVNQVPC